MVQRFVSRVFALDCFLNAAFGQVRARFGKEDSVS